MTCLKSLTSPFTHMVSSPKRWNRLMHIRIALIPMCVLSALILPKQLLAQATFESVPFPIEPDGIKWKVVDEAQTPGSVPGFTAEAQSGYLAQDQGNYNGTWQDGEPILLRTASIAFARSLLIPNGTVIQETDNEVHIPFSVASSGYYELTVDVFIDQFVSDIHAQLFGLSRPSFIASNKIQVLEGDPASPTVVYSWTLSEHEKIDTFGSAIADASIESFVAIVSAVFEISPEGTAVFTALDLASDVLDSGSDDDATFATGTSVHDTIHLNAGSNYYLSFKTEQWVFSQIFALLGLQWTHVDTDMQVQSISFNGTPSLNVMDSQGDPDDGSINFGEVPTCADATHSITLFNNGTTNLTIESWSSSNPSLSIAQENPTGPVGDQIIQPGLSLTIDVVFGPGAIGDYSGVISIRSSDLPDSPYYLNVTGTGIECGTGVTVMASPNPVTYNQLTTINANVRDSFGNPVGAGEPVHFATECAGFWSPSDDTVTDSQGVASAEFTPQEGGTWTVTAQHVIPPVPYPSGSTVMTVNPPSADCTPSPLVSAIGVGNSQSTYLAEFWFEDNGNPLNNQSVTFSTSLGTIQGPDSSTDSNGHCEVDILTTESGQATVCAHLTEIPGQCCTTALLQVGPVPGHPIGRSLSVPGSITTNLDINAQGSKIAVGSATTITVFDTSTWQGLSHNESNFSGNQISGIAFDGSGNKLMAVTNSRRMGLFDVSGSPSTLMTWINDSAEGLGNGLSIDWCQSCFVVGHSATSSRPYEFSSWGANGPPYTGKVNINAAEDDNVTRLAANPTNPSRFAAVNEAPQGSGHNYVYSSQQGCSLSSSSVHTFAPSIKLNGALAWSADGTQLLVGSNSADTHQAFIYNTSDLSQSNPTPAGNLTVFDKSLRGAFSSDDAYIAIFYGSGIEIFDGATGAIRFRIPNTVGGQGLVWLPGTHILIAAGGSTIQFIYIDDNTPPDVMITYPTQGLQTSDDMVTVQGTASDASGIQSVTISVNGGPETPIDFDENGHFSEDVTLAPGNNHITVTATDNAGLTGSPITRDITRITDQLDPVLESVEISPSGRVSPSDAVTITANVSDADGSVDDGSVEATVQLAGMPIATIPLMAQGDGTYSGTWDTAGAAAGDYHLDITACDLESHCPVFADVASIIVNQAPQITITQPTEDIELSWGQSYTVMWTTSDPDSNALTSIYIDDDQAPPLGVPVTGGIGLSGAVSSIVVNGSDLPPGNYYVAINAADEYGSTQAWSAGRLVVSFPDCNANGVPDDEDISSGTSQDCNGTLTPDECDLRGDINGNGTVDTLDTSLFVATILGMNTDCNTLADVNLDGSANGQDVQPFVQALLTEPPASSLVGYWPLDDGTGNTAADASGNGFDGTLINGPTWAADGICGSALCFDATDDYVNLGPGFLDDGPFDEITVEAWIRSNGCPTDYPNPHSWAIAAETADGEFELGIVSDDGVGRLLMYTSSGPINLFGTTPLKDGEWHQLRATFDSTVVELYVDGVVEASAAATGPLVVNGSRIAAIGAHYTNNVGSGYFCGCIDEVAIYASGTGQTIDQDSDAVPDSCDNCPSLLNPGQEDTDDDGVGDACDTCTDTDGDGFGDPGFPVNTCPDDNCPAEPNPLQADEDRDGIGDLCEDDRDNDGVVNCLDNCPETANPLQGDVDGDGLGDACDWDLVAYWKFDENGGTSTADSSGNGHTSVSIEGASWTTAAICGSALAFNGTSDFVDFGTQLLGGDVFPALSVEAWIKTSGFPANYSFSQAWIVSNETSDGEFNLGVDSADGTVLVSIYGAGGTALLHSPGSVVDGQWHHLRVNLGSAQAELFVDGALVDSAATFGPLTTNGTTHVTVGCKWTNVPKSFFPGIIDEVAIYASAAGTLDVDGDNLPDECGAPCQLALDGVVPLGGRARYVAMSPDGTRAYVSVWDPPQVKVLDTGNDTVVDTWNLQTGNANDLVTSPDGTRLYIVSNTTNDLRIWDTVAGMEVCSIPLGNSPVGIGISPDGSRGYVKTNAGADIAVVDFSADACTVTATIPSETGPGFVAVSPNARRAYVSNADQGSVYVVDTTANVILDTIAAASAGALAISPDGAYLYVAQAPLGRIQVFYIEDNCYRALDAIDIAGGPADLTIDPQGRRLFVTTESNDMISVIDMTTRTVRSAYDTEDVPLGVAIDPANQRAYVANDNGHSVSVFDISTCTD